MILQHWEQFNSQPGVFDNLNDYFLEIIRRGEDHRFWFIRAVTNAQWASPYQVICKSELLKMFSVQLSIYYGQTVIEFMRESLSLDDDFVADANQCLLLDALTEEFAENKVNAGKAVAFLKDQDKETLGETSKTQTEVEEDKTDKELDFKQVRKKINEMTERFETSGDSDAIVELPEEEASETFRETAKARLKTAMAFKQALCSLPEEGLDETKIAVELQQAQQSQVLADSWTLRNTLPIPVLLRLMFASLPHSLFGLHGLDQTKKLRYTLIAAIINSCRQQLGLDKLTLAEPTLQEAQFAFFSAVQYHPQLSNIEKKDSNGS